MTARRRTKAEIKEHWQQLIKQIKQRQCEEWEQEHAQHGHIYEQLIGMHWLGTHPNQRTKKQIDDSVFWEIRQHHYTDELENLISSYLDKKRNDK